MKSGNLNFLEPSGPLQACNGTAVPLPYLTFPYKNSTRMHIIVRQLRLWIKMRVLIFWGKKDQLNLFQIKTDECTHTLLKHQFINTISLRNVAAAKGQQWRQQNDLPDVQILKFEIVTLLHWYEQDTENWTKFHFIRNISTQIFRSL